MERSEPALAPEWLRCSSGAGTSTHHFALSPSQSDVLSSTVSPRNRSSRSNGDKVSPRSAFLDRSSSSDGSTKHPYSSFSRSNRDKKEKDRSVSRDLWDHDCSDPLGSILSSKVETIALRRSQSMVSRKPGEALPRRTSDLNKSIGSTLSSGMQKVAFEKDFPSLGTEEKQGAHDIGRVPSPGLSLPIGNSIGGEGWTSALAEVPAIIGGIKMGSISVQPSVVATPTPGISSAMVGLNMAAALTQAPSRACTTTQVPDKTQRLEELAIKQSRQLIPMRPSTPKPLVINPLDKSKQPKTAIRTGEIAVPLKSTQQGSLSRRGVEVRSDSTMTSHSGKFHVLKPLRENGVSSAAKDNGVSNSHNLVAPLTPTAPTTRPTTIARKAQNPKSNTEKKPVSSQAKSRSEFFNLMRKKNPTGILSETSPIVESSGEISKEVVNNGAAPEESPILVDAAADNDSCPNGMLYPDEEEAAFLRSLGWDENGEEDEGLTEEEINSFYQEYMKLRPSLKVHRAVLPKV